MFNLGGDDKEKLKENMEEIKELVNSQSEDEEQDKTAEEPSTEQKEDLENLRDTVERSENSESQEAQEKQTSPRGDYNQTPERNLPEDQDNQRGSMGLSSENSDMKENLESISSEVKKMEGSDRPDGETLFLEVDEFNQVEEMVEEMKYLSREMKDLMDNLENGVEEDRRVEGEAQDVLNEFTERREKIQSSIQ